MPTSPGGDLSDYFFGRRNSKYKRRRQFVDRDDQRRILSERARSVWGDGFQVSRLANFDRPATNLTVLIGDSGIGKTRLSQEALSPVAAPLCRIDFDDPANFDFERILLKMRGSVAVQNVKCPAFDTLLYRYWEEAHPGSPLEEHLGKASFLTQVQRSELLAEVGSVIDSALEAQGLLGLGYRAGRAATDLMRRRSDMARIKAEFDPFTQLFEAESPAQTLPFLAAALAYDLFHHSATKPLTPAVIFDSFENVQNLEALRPGGLEDLIARLIFLMPNVHAVVTTRQLLTWAEPTKRGRWFYAGEAHWPHLWDGSAVIPVGPLPDEDAYLLLRSDIDVEPGHEMPAELTSKVISSSGGSPYYLDLSLDQYMDDLIQGNEPSIDRYGRSFGETVLRMASDLTSAQRRLLRAGAVLPSFDSATLMAAAPQSTGSDIERFLQRSFVRKDSSRWPPYSYHPSLRTAIKHSDPALPDHWTPDEWHNATRAAFGALAQVGLSAWRTSAESDAAGRAQSALMVGIDALAARDLAPTAELAQLFVTVLQFHGSASLSSLAVPDKSVTAATLLLGLAAVDSDRNLSSLDRAKAIEALKNVAESDSNLVDILSVCRFEFAKWAQDAELYNESEAAYEAAMDVPGPLGSLSRIAYAGTALRRGALRTALERVPVFEEDQTVLNAAVRDLHGHVFLHGGDFSRAHAAFADAYTLATRANSAVWRARASRHMVSALMWCEPKEAAAALPLARELNAKYVDVVGLVQCDMAESLIHAHNGDLDHARRILREVRNGNVNGMAAGYLPMLEALYSSVAGTADEIVGEVVTAAANEVGTHTWHEVGTHTWHAVADLWRQGGPTELFTSIEWYDSVADALTRWTVPQDILKREYRTGPASE